MSGFGVGADNGIPETGLAAQALDGRHGVGNGFMPIALLFADHEQFLARPGLVQAATKRRRRNNRRHAIFIHQKLYLSAN